MSSVAEPFNQRLGIPAGDIRYLWETGHPTDDALGLYSYPETDYIRSKRSENGEWHLKLDPVTDPDLDGLSLEQICDLHAVELERFQQVGIRVISFARAVFPSRRTLTVTPWMDGMEFVPDERFDTEVAPRVDDYYRGWMRGYRQLTRDYSRYFIADVHGEQFSSIDGVGPAFYHDLDPTISKSPSLARQLIHDHAQHEQNTN